MQGLRGLVGQAEGRLPEGSVHSTNLVSLSAAWKLGASVVLGGYFLALLVHCFWIGTCSRISRSAGVVIV